jgi:predicted NAD/FAD-dependent oxidoreductase
MTPSTAPDVLVIGAGIAGLTAARALSRTGLAVAVLEKSRGVGGRAATRTVHGARVDHGAQFFTARDPRFRAEVDAWLRDGVARAWADGFPSWSERDGWREPEPGANPRYACPDGMNALGKRLAEGLAVTRRARAVAVRHGDGAWEIELEGGERRRAPRVVVTAPVPQALELVREVAWPAGTRAGLEAVTYAPCFAVLAGYPDVPAPGWPGVRLPAHPDLAWIANDGTKRHPRSGGTVLVLHATPAFTRQRFDDPPAAVVADLLRAASAAVPWAGRPAWTDHQRWRYALAEAPHPERALSVADGLVLCGDGFGGDGGGRLESAYLSGLAAAEALLGEAAA